MERESNLFQRFKKREAPWLKVLKTAEKCEDHPGAAARERDSPKWLTAGRRYRLK